MTRPPSTRDNRVWTAVIAECALDRARRLLAVLRPDIAQVDLPRALAATGIAPDRDTPFATLWPALEQALGPDGPAVHTALAQLPFEAPSTALWRALLRDLHGPNQPQLTGDDAPNWTAFLAAYRGRTPAPAFTAPWLQAIAQGTADHRALVELANTARAAPLTPQDRRLYLRFGWNDDGAVPGLTGLLDAAALLRTQTAWSLAAPQFDPRAQARIRDAAQHMVTLSRVEAMSDLSADARRYGVTREQAAALYPVRVVPPLTTLLQEAA
jgi:hypothetical protein